MVVWVGVPKGEGLEGERTPEPETWAPKGGEPKFFGAFFPLSSHNVHSFFPLLGVFSWNFGGVLKTGTLKCARLGSRVVV